jgi:hypothetical protein
MFFSQKKIAFCDFRCETLLMIHFDQMKVRLKGIGKDRTWLAENTPYSADYIRTVLAPNSTRRTDRIQEILSNAIEREEQRKHLATLDGAQELCDRITIECTPEERREWDQAARGQERALDDWIVGTLNTAAEFWQSTQQQLKVAEDPHTDNNSQAAGNGGSVIYPRKRREHPKDIDKEKEA